MKTQNGAHFYRYIRPYDEKHGHISNLGGATLAFTLDYETRTVNVGFSVCSKKENFNAEIGRSIADNKAYSINLDRFQSFAEQYQGYVPAFMKYLEAKQFDNDLSDREYKLFEVFNSQQES